MKIALKTTSFAILLLSMTITHADLAFFSRANCLNNESISYDPDQPRWMITKSWHYYNDVYIHCKDNVSPEDILGLQNADTCIDEWTYDKRNAAVHWGEGLATAFTKEWEVSGVHQEWHYGGDILWGATVSNDCSINSFTEFYDQFFK